jgi:hypothetical protein
MHWVLLAECRVHVCIGCCKQIFLCMYVLGAVSRVSYARVYWVLLAECRVHVCIGYCKQICVCVCALVFVQACKQRGACCNLDVIHMLVWV